MHLSLFDSFAAMLSRQHQLLKACVASGPPGLLERVKHGWLAPGITTVSFVPDNITYVLSTVVAVDHRETYIDNPFLVLRVGDHYIGRVQSDTPQLLVIPPLQNFGVESSWREIMKNIGPRSYSYPKGTVYFFGWKIKSADNEQADYAKE